MAPELRHRIVLVAVVDDRPVVAGEDHQGVVGQLQPVERVEDLADRPVRLDDDVTARSDRGLAGEPRMRHARHVRVVQGEEQEERLRLLLLDEADGAGE